jgi:hypothetical protein
MYTGTYSSNNFNRGGYRSLEPELPSHGETHGGIDISGRELDEASSRRIVHHHLSKRIPNRIEHQNALGVQITYIINPTRMPTIA